MTKPPRRARTRSPDPTPPDAPATPTFDDDFANVVAEWPVAPFRKALLRWFAAEGRVLPWRASRDAYAVWISEIMLQQTTIAAVKPYFERFLARFPDVQALAQADEHEVLRLWEGLGYYSRARNLHRAARVITDDLGGVFPNTVDGLQALPGIGRYTAGAIASFAFGEPAPIVEANTLRLYCRLLGYTGDPRSSAGQQVLWSFAERLPSRGAAGEVNAALMDLGATVCTIAEPKCASCRVRRWCRAAAAGSQASIPRAASRPELTDLRHAYVAVRRGQDYLLRQHLPTERWAGLWDFPRVDWPETEGLAGLTESVRQLTGLTCELGDEVAELRHGVTRYRITVHCYTAEFLSGELEQTAQYAWVPPADFSTRAVSVTARKLAQRLSGSLFG